MLTGRMDDANSYLTKLSRLLRKVLNYSDYENISLEKELEMLRLYLELENIRLKGAINYKIDIDEDVDSAEIQIPTLILQPFAENAIWHGLVNKKGEKNLFVHISSVNRTLVCVIEDNGIGRVSASSLKKKQSSHISKGMELITRRLEIIKLKSELGNACFTVEDLYTPDQIACGTKIKIILPMPLT